MDAAGLREMQAPLKTRYRDEPSAALIFRGTLGVDRAAPVGFSAIRLTFALQTDEPQDRIDSLLKLTERYCVVLQTLRNPPEIVASISEVPQRPGHA